MPPRRIYDDDPGIHYLTFSCYHSRRFLEHDKPCRIVLGQLSKRLADREALCLGFVLMPDHLHAMIWLPKPAMLSGFIDAWKTQTSKLIAKFYAANMPKYWNSTGADDRIWQARYYDFNVLSAAKAEEKLNYMHANPARAGFVERPTDWRWSSAAWYA